MDSATEELGDPEPPLDEDPISRLRRLKGLLEEGLIEQAEYDEAKARVLAEV